MKCFFQKKKKKKSWKKNYTVSSYGANDIVHNAKHKIYKSSSAKNTFHAILVDLFLLCSFLTLCLYYVCAVSFAHLFPNECMSVCNNVMLNVNESFNASQSRDFSLHSFLIVNRNIIHFILNAKNKNKKISGVRNDRYTIIYEDICLVWSDSQVHQRN